MLNRGYIGTDNFNTIQFILRSSTFTLWVIECHEFPSQAGSFAYCLNVLSLESLLVVKAMVLYHQYHSMVPGFVMMNITFGNLQVCFILAMYVT